MKTGDNINGYTLLSDFRTAGGGHCRWTFASKRGEEFFIKEFLRPTYPDEGLKASEATKTRKREECRVFEQHQRSLISAVSTKCAKGGNVIFARDFFRHRAKYYKVTEKVDIASVEIGDIASLSLDRRVLVMKTVAHSLRVLHKLDIVHGDLKPNNILIKLTKLGNYVTKLIDFDNSFFSGKPPKLSEDVVGDFVYYSPELARYVNADKKVRPDELRLSSDIFALGLIYCQYLTGQLPDFDRAKYQYACIAANNGVRLRISSDGIPPHVISIVDWMLSTNYNDRPTIDAVYSHLKASDRMPVDSPAPDLYSSSITSTAGSAAS